MKFCTVERRFSKVGFSFSESTRNIQSAGGFERDDAFIGRAYLVEHLQLSSKVAPPPPGRRPKDYR